MQYAIFQFERSAFAEIYGEIVNIDLTGVLRIAYKYNRIFSGIKRNIECKRSPLTPVGRRNNRQRKLAHTRTVHIKT